LAAKLTPDEAAARFEASDTLGMPLATGQPAKLIEALAKRDDWFDLRVYAGLLAVPPDLFRNEHVHYLSGFFGPLERFLRDNGANISFAPSDFRGFEPLMRAVAPRVMATAASPPDDGGWCSLSLHAGAFVDELKRAGADPTRILLVETSPSFPHTLGVPPDHPHALHMDEIDILVQSDAVPFAFPDADAAETDRLIAEHARRFIADGATLQTGIGAVPSMIAKLLAEGDGGDYGVHSEMFTTGLMHLHRSGKVTNRKGQYDGFSVATFAGGTAELYEWLDHNEEVRFLPVDIVNDPAVIGRNREMVTINGAIAVDIQGQVVADTIAGTQYSGIGGHEDFVSGAALKLENRSLLCLPSTVTVKDKVHSRILPVFPEATVITTPRHQVDVVVTEYGAAELRGKTIHQRGDALAAVAHPDFRDELLEAAENASHGRSPLEHLAK
jgi:acyl-CoA hydrolase